MQFPVTMSGVTLAGLFASVAEAQSELACGEALEIQSVAPLSYNADGTFSFSRSSPQATQANNTLQPGSIIVAKRDPEAGIPADWPKEVGLVLADNPRRWFIQAVRVLFASQLRPEPGVHRLANVEAGAQIDPTASISAFATIGAGASIGPGVFVESGAVIGARARLGEGVYIGPNTVLGVAGLALERDADDRQVHLPHLGTIEVGEGTRIGANSVIVRGSLTDTVIGAGCMIGNLVNIGHNIQIGDECFIGPKTVLCGSVRIGRRCWIAPGSTVLNKMRLGDNVMIGLGSVVMKSFSSNSYAVGNPARLTPKLNRFNKYNR